MVRRGDAEAETAMKCAWVGGAPRAGDCEREGRGRNVPGGPLEHPDRHVVGRGHWERCRGAVRGGGAWSSVDSVPSVLTFSPASGLHHPLGVGLGPMGNGGGTLRGPGVARDSPNFLEFPFSFSEFFKLWVAVF